MAEYPVLDGAGGTVVSVAFDSAWTRPSAHDYEDQYPVLDGTGGTVVGVQTLGPEKVSNPRFSGGVDGWTDFSDAGGEIRSGVLGMEVANLTGSARVKQLVDVESGETYTVKFVNGSGERMTVYVDNVSQGTLEAYETLEGDHVAASSTMDVSVRNFITGTVGVVKEVSVRRSA